MALTSGLNANDVKTALDDVFWQNFNVDSHPDHATAETPSVFHQDTADSSAVIWELFQGVGQWESRQEEQDVPQGTPRIGNQKTFTVSAFAKQVKVPKHFFDDDKHAVYEMMVRNMAQRARTTRDSNAFAVFRNAFTTATTADGVALLSNSHTALNGATIDNLLTGALDETTLNTAIIQNLELAAQDGVIGGNLPTVLLVAPAGYKNAVEITESKLRANTPDNDLNVYSTKYGIRVGTSQWLGAAAGGDDDAWFLLSEKSEHKLKFFWRVRLGALKRGTDFDSTNLKHLARMRFSVGYSHWMGTYGTNGA